MEKINLPYFGEIEIKNIKEEYETEIEFKGEEVDIFLNEMSEAEEKLLGFIKGILEDLSKYENKNKEFIATDFKKNPCVTQDFLSFHLEELELGSEFSSVHSENLPIDNMWNLMNELKLKTISFYSDLVTFDYSFCEELTDEILVVRMDRNKTLSIAWES